jgi:aspartyl/asparaginyl beta-hydroxylase (cupin superfamily)
MAGSDTSEQIEAGLEALRAQDPARAAALLRPLAGATHHLAFPWLALANAEILLGNLAAAAEAVDRRLTEAPRDLAALLQRGRLHEQAGNRRAAVAFYQAARNQAVAEGGSPPQLRPWFEHAAQFSKRAHEEFSERLTEATRGPLSDTMTELIGLLQGEREIDLQRPSVMYYPGLAQQRFFDPRLFPWLEPMLKLLPEMRAELAAISESGDDGFAPYVRSQPNRPAPNNPLLDSDAWTAFHFWKDGTLVEENARRCPATIEALAHAPMPRVPNRSPNAHWSRLLPGAHIRPHVGMLNTRLICHIPIKTAPHCTLRVGSETRGWDEGVPLIFDDSMEHEARNAGDQERVVLLFEIWRPEIPEEDRAVIARIFAAIGEAGI